VVSTVLVARAHPSKLLESFLFGFSCSGGGPVRMECNALYVISIPRSNLCTVFPLGKTL